MPIYSHSGPVTQLKLSPSKNDMILSCSSDWSLKLWKIEKNSDLRELMIFKFTEQIIDINWCPYNDKVFVSATRSSIQLWNIDESVLDPSFTIEIQDKSGVSAVLFSKNAPVLVVALTDGRIELYSILDPSIIQDFPFD